jgi:hypothetical protein
MLSTYKHNSGHEQVRHLTDLGNWTWIQFAIQHLFVR